MKQNYFSVALRLKWMLVFCLLALPLQDVTAQKEDKMWKIDVLEQEFAKVKDSLQFYRQKLAELRGQNQRLSQDSAQIAGEWRRICEKYLAAPDITDLDLIDLKNRTVAILDGEELYALLEDRINEKKGIGSDNRKDKKKKEKPSEDEQQPISSPQEDVNVEIDPLTGNPY